MLRLNVELKVEYLSQMEKFVETEKMLKKKFRARQENEVEKKGA